MTMLSEPDACATAQYLWVHRPGANVLPERALVLAVLRDAIETFQKFVCANSCRGRALFAEAEEWISAEDAEWPFSFNNVCEFLGLNSARLRYRLRAWKTQQRPSSSRTVKLRWIGNKQVNVGVQRPSRVCAQNSGAFVPPRRYKKLRSPIEKGLRTPATPQSSRHTSSRTRRHSSPPPLR